MSMKFWTLKSECKLLPNDSHWKSVEKYFKLFLPSLQYINISLPMWCGLIFHFLTTDGAWCSLLCETVSKLFNINFWMYHVPTVWKRYVDYSGSTNLCWMYFIPGFNIQYLHLQKLHLRADNQVHVISVSI